MAGRQWGLLCPEGHGLLVEREQWTAIGVAWCPHSEHDIADSTSGRFYRRQEVEEGWFDPSAPRIKSAALIEQERRAAERAAERETMAFQKKAEAAKTKTKAKAPREPKVVEPKDCLCGCGGQTKGGRFIPGHDARFHSRVKALMAFDSSLTHEAAEGIASKGPLTGKYAAAQAPKPKAEKAPKAEPVPAPEAAPAVADEAPAEAEEEGDPVIAG